jgi:hypothetical protein
MKRWVDRWPELEQPNAKFDIPIAVLLNIKYSGKHAASSKVCFIFYQVKNITLSV